MELTGLHHVTAVTGQASLNVAFYSQVLGLRLIKKTVNQDDVSAYHLFYGDEVGSPGTELTFFDWPSAGSHVQGSGAVGSIALRVPADRLDWWARRLDEFGVAHAEAEQRFGRATIAFRDPEGQRLELVADDGDRAAGAPWAHSPVPAAAAIRGMAWVRLVVRDLEPTARLLTRILGFRQSGEYEYAADGEAPATTVVFETGPGGLGAELHVEVRPGLPPAWIGIGGVHHVAFRTPNPAEHLGWQTYLAAQGVGVTPVIDRYYFRSIYFREPGGTLFEIATDGPGFATDEDVEHLGERLALPPFLEPYRAEIERGLRPIEPVDLRPGR